MWRNRKDGEESPYIPMGPFKLRIPFIHYKFEWADYTQGLLMCAVDLAAIPLLIELLGMPFEVALAVVLLNGILYLTHHLLGDPVVPGWITPAIPLIMLYVSQFPEGAERVHALISFQLTLGIFSIFLGVTGLAKRVVSLVPSAIKSGVIMGAGIAAVITVFEVGGDFESFPWTITIAMAAAFYFIYSTHFNKVKRENPILGLIGKLGILPIFVIAIIVGPLVNEVPWPNIEWGFSKPDFITLWSEYTVFGIGFPPLKMIILGLPTVLATYIVLFGDILQSQALLSEADEARKDEKIDYNPNRAHMIFGGRNTIMSIAGPDVTMAGPLWAAMQVIVVERYKEGKKAMHSIFSGSGSFRWGTNTGLLLLPIVSLVEPILGIALASTLLIQGFVSVRIGVFEAKSHRDLGIAGIVGAILATKGATWAFAAGIILCLVVYGKNFFKGDPEKVAIEEQILE